MGRDRVKGHLDLLLLSVLRSGPLHGYEAITALRERSGGQFDVPEGTVYPSLHRLEAAGLLRSWWDHSGPRKRRAYQLTANGENALRTERDAWRRFAAGVNAVVGMPA